jgi:hypothetical protein
MNKKVWPDTFVEDSNLAFNIFVLRKLFGESSASPHYIETVPKRGYRFVAEEVQEELSDTEGVKEDSAQSAAFLKAAPNLEVPERRAMRLAPTRTIVIALLTLVVVGILTYYWRRAPKLTDNDTIVLADFTNTTGDPVFDGTLRQGLAMELGQSPFLSLISEERIQRMLPLMGQPRDARLTPELAREICSRTASAAVLEGSIVPLGSQYVLTLRAKNCHTGEILDAELVQAGKKEDVLNALTQITRKFRTRIGESLATLEKYDTPISRQPRRQSRL